MNRIDEWPKKEEMIISIVVVKLPQRVVRLKANWSFLDSREGEIDEKSKHNLSRKIASLGISRFSVKGNTMFFTNPEKSLQDVLLPLMTFLFEKAERENRGRKFIESYLSS